MGRRRASLAALAPATPTEADRRWPLVVRRARPEDRDAVLRFASRTWDGWDYIPHAWPAWLEAADGVLLVASAGVQADGSDALDADGSVVTPDEPIAVARVALLSPDEGWLEGIRVDPRVRGLGVATDLQAAELHWLAAHRPRVIRYATGARNEASHRLGGRHGFELLTSYQTWAWRDPSRPEGEEDQRGEHGYDEAARRDASRGRQKLLARLADAGLAVGRGDAERWWQRLTADGGFAAAGNLYELRSWAMQRLTGTLFAGHVTAGEVIVLEAEDGWALAILTGEALPSEDVSIHLALLAGDGPAMVRLADTIRRQADGPIRLRLAVGEGLPAGRLVRAFAAVGFSARPWELHVLARDSSAPLPEIDAARLVLADPPRNVIRP